MTSPLAWGISSSPRRVCRSESAAPSQEFSASPSAPAALLPLALHLRSPRASRISPNGLHGRPPPHAPRQFSLISLMTRRVLYSALAALAVWASAPCIRRRVGGAWHRVCGSIQRPCTGWRNTTLAQFTPPHVRRPANASVPLAVPQSKAVPAVAGYRRIGTGAWLVALGRRHAGNHPPSSRVRPNPIQSHLGAGRSGVKPLPHGCPGRLTTTRDGDMAWVFPAARGQQDGQRTRGQWSVDQCIHRSDCRTERRWIGRSGGLAQGPDRSMVVRGSCMSDAQKYAVEWARGREDAWSHYCICAYGVTVDGVEW